MVNKKGFITYFLVIFALIVIIILSSVNLIYLQMTNKITSLKKDLFYIVQNTYMMFDKNELSYDKYVVDNNKLKEKIEELLILNYPKDNIVIESVKYNAEENLVYISVKVEFKPVIFNKIFKDKYINISRKIKIKTMEVSK